MICGRRFGGVNLRRDSSLTPEIAGDKIISPLLARWRERSQTYYVVVDDVPRVCAPVRTASTWDPRLLQVRGSFNQGFHEPC